MTGFTPQSRDFEDRVHVSFAGQTFMETIGARITRLEPGIVDLTLEKRHDLCQQHGYIHAGVTTALLDTAAGYAAFSLFKPGEEVLTTEFKVNLLRPAKGAFLVAEGRVVKPGKTLTVCRSDVYAHQGGEDVLVATALLSMIAVKTPAV